MTLNWDERYRLTSASSDISTVNYSYDVQDRRVSRVEDDVTNFFIYDVNQVVADLDGNGDILRSYVWRQGIDNLLSFTDHTSSSTYYAIKDHQNTVLAMVDEAGAVVESYEYDAYGNTTVLDASGTELSESAIGNRYMFQGREYDSSTGLYYFRARWYDSDSGRWLSKDPIGIEGGLNLYEFCGSNPVNNVDPEGESLSLWIGALIVTAVVTVYSMISNCSGNKELGKDMDNLNSAAKQAFDATDAYADALNGNDLDAMIDAEAKRAKALQGLVEPTVEAGVQATRMGTGSLGSSIITQGIGQGAGGCRE
jgi:RHS repeat-associated protein